MLDRHLWEKALDYSLRLSASCVVSLGFPRDGFCVSQISVYRFDSQVSDADLRRNIHETRATTTGVVRVPTEVRRAGGQR